MADQVQNRRGTTAEINVFSGAEGEITVDTTKDTAVVHDGTKQGGYPLAREDLSNVQVFGLGRKGVVPATASTDANRVLYGDGSWRAISSSGGGGGKSAYESALDYGFVGTEEEWLASLIGPGFTSATVTGDDLVITRTDTTTFTAGNVRGPQGIQGTKGDKGDTGDVGPAGPVALTTLRTVSTTTYTFVAGDAERMLITDNAAAKTVTVPTNASVAMPYTANGSTTTVAILNTGTGVLTLAPASGVTFIRKPAQALTVQQYGVVVLTKINTDTWYLSGDLDS